MISLICGISNMTHMSLSVKWTYRHIAQPRGCQGGRGWGRDGLEVWDYQIQTGVCRTDEQQSPTV